MLMIELAVYNQKLQKALNLSIMRFVHAVI